MPRKARQKSSTGIYHIMLRGLNKQDIFHEDEDRIKYIETLKKYKDISDYKIYAYCLMDNHIHLLIKEVKESISQSMKRIGVGYVHWYNKKYERCGHLFQDRYKSEVVEDDKYLMVVLRYIHQNPLKLPDVKSFNEYQWSSYKDFIYQNSKLTDIDFILNILDDDHNEAVERFKRFMNEKNDDDCLSYYTKKNTLTDEDAKELIKQCADLDNPEILKEMDKKDRDYIIKKLRNNNISIRQLSRITGLGRGVIEKANKVKKIKKGKRGRKKKKK